MQVQNEIDDIWATKQSGEELSYDDYPKMRVIMALMVSNPANNPLYPRAYCYIARSPAILPTRSHAAQILLKQHPNTHLRREDYPDTACEQNKPRHRRRAKKSQILGLRRARISSFSLADAIRLHTTA
jgi:hypothetical protein